MQDRQRRFEQWIASEASGCCDEDEINRLLERCDDSDGVVYLDPTVQIQWQTWLAAVEPHVTVRSL